jgi:alanyl-tRNA synthetase
VHDNYDIDLFRALIAASVEATGVPAEGAAAPSHRVIADHLRATSFLIADGVLPSNEGRGYVLRRIMRRAMRHGHLLGAREPLLWRLVPTLVREMGQSYGELVRAEPLITETLNLEETRFRKTLSRGLSLLEDASAGMGRGAVLPGETAFRLYDTYGFPLDLTQDALKPRGITVDLKGFNSAMEAQKAEARKAWKGSGEAQTESLWFELKERLGATEFLGYDTETAEGEIKAIIKDGKEVKGLKSGEEGQLVLNQTPFYGESGGQVGDQGLIRVGKDNRFRVTGTQKKLGEIWAHMGAVEAGALSVGDAATLEVDHERRTATRANHSATHLLHEALRQVLGEHVAQKGSLVEPGRLRFDFSHPKPMTPEEIEEVEDLANAMILQNSPVETRIMDVNEAMETGARALFGEKYGDEVRVVSMGRRTSGTAGGKPYSVELCGGTHTRRTGDIGIVHIVSESAVAAGVRRIEALTAIGARRHLKEQEARIRGAAAALKIAPGDLVKRVAELAEERRRLERQVADLKRQIALGGSSASPATDSSQPVQTIGRIKVLARRVDGIPLKDLRGLVDDGKKQVGSGIVAIVGVSEDGKAGVAVGVTDDLTQRWNAVDLVRLGAEALGGKGGGGRADMAQAGGPNGAKAAAAIAAIRERIRGEAS